jgi:hypothetical protein
MDKLIDLGFVRAGEFRFENKTLNLNIHQHSNATPCLYALIETDEKKNPDFSANQIFYIGHTRRNFRARMDDYRRGLGTAVNKRVHDHICRTLENGKCVESWVWIDALFIQVRDLKVDVAAGLEYNLIRYYQTYNKDNKHIPLLNVAGIESSPNEFIEIDKEVIELPKAGQKLDMNNNAFDFTITLGETYWNQSVFNIPIEFSNRFGNDGDQINIEFVSKNILENIIEEKINRRANLNKTPRIYMHGSDGQWYLEWIHKNFIKNDKVFVQITKDNIIRLISN